SDGRIIAMLRSSLRVLALCTAAVAVCVSVQLAPVIGLASAEPASAAGSAVTISNFAFNPSGVTINVGDTVTGPNNDPPSHTATSDTGLWDSGTLAAGRTFSQAFTSAGTFAYHCTIHPSMKGTITVVAAAAASPTAARSQPTAAPTT